MYKSKLKYIGLFFQMPINKNICSTLCTLTVLFMSIFSKEIDFLFSSVKDSMNCLTGMNAKTVDRVESGQSYCSIHSRRKSCCIRLHAKKKKKKEIEKNMHDCCKSNEISLNITAQNVIVQ